MNNPDETDLPAARRELTDAIHELCGGRTLPVQGTLAFGPSLLADLDDYIEGARGNGQGSHARSMPPIVIDAVDLQQKITTTIRAWVGPGKWLTNLEHAKWRPQDAPLIRQYARTIRGWIIEIEQLLNPPKRAALAAPCPSCDTRTVYRRDKAGEYVRQPALQIDAETGCTCQHCGAYWGPEKFLFLAGALGFERPPGVLE